MTLSHSKPHQVGIWHPRPGPHPVHTMHRLSAAVLGVFLVVFGALGLGRRLPFFSTTGSIVLGLSSNGMLALLSVVVGVVLVLSAAQGGHLASTVSMTLGVLFLLSGVVNSALLATSLNLLAFRPPNVLFSLGVGAVLLITGAYGRVTGGLPADNPYHRDVPPPAPPSPEELAERKRDYAAARELADAELAYVLHQATPEELRRLERVHQYRTMEDRLHAWRQSASAAR